MMRLYLKSGSPGHKKTTTRNRSSFSSQVFVDRLSSGSCSLSFLSLVALVSSTVSDRSLWLFQPVYNLLCTRARQASVGIAIDPPDRGIQKPVGLKDLFPFPLLGLSHFTWWSHGHFSFHLCSSFPLISPSQLNSPISPQFLLSPPRFCVHSVLQAGPLHGIWEAIVFHFTFVYIYDRFSRP